MRIRDLREDADITQKEIAAYLHIRQNTYSQYENGQRQLPVNVLIALAKYYRLHHAIPMVQLRSDASKRKMFQPSWTAWKGLFHEYIYS